jgi:hypothetical protein
MIALRRRDPDPMLSDSQIERYSRQIVLPEIGARGQELLLRSTVSIRGRGDADVVCASYLAGAGVGTLALEEPRRGGSIADVLDLERRNPDCRIVHDEVDAPDMLVAIGSDWRSPFPTTGVVWGGGAPQRVATAHFPKGEACESCLAAVAREVERGGGSSQILGALLAVETLRILLGLTKSDRPRLLSLDLHGGVSTSSPFPFRPDCRCRRSPRGEN